MKYSRRIFYVTPDFQRSFILRYVAVSVLGALISGLFVYTIISRSMEFGILTENPALIATWALLRPTIILSHLIGVAVVITAGVLLTLQYSHRIAGPFYRVEKVASEVETGNLSVKFTFRKGDELAPMEDILKGMITGLQMRVRAMATPVVSLHKQEAEILDAIRRSDLSDEKKRHLESAVSTELARAVEAAMVFALDEDEGE
jgi:methyl-accepting chemotaxis protein